MSQTNTANTVVGYFESHADAERAVSALQDAGFTSAHLGLAARGGQTGSYSSGASTASSVANTAGQKAEGAWDKLKNFFNPDPVEPYADERQSGDLASHEITPGYNYGSDFHETLQGMSVPQDQSKYFGHRFGSGDQGAIVTVSAPGREAEARAILQKNGADLGENASTYDYSNTTANTTTEGAQNIQLLGEVLRVHKDRISAGEVRFRKEVITDMQTVQVPVTREELVIERHAVAGATPAQGTIGEGTEIRIPLTEERASLDKSTVVREEVSVGKRAIENVENLTGETRREELVVEDETKTTANAGTTNTTGTTFNR